jgi:hypothetical protein
LYHTPRKLVFHLEPDKGSQADGEQRLREC